MQQSLSWLAALAYAMALFGLWRHTTMASDEKTHLRALIISAVIVAAALHAVSLYSSAESILGVKLSLAGSLSLVALAAVIVFVMLSMLRSTLTLGLAIIPFAILALLTGSWLNPSLPADNLTNAALNLHLIFATITFAVLSLAAAQSVIIIVQQHRLKHHTSEAKGHLALHSFPPLQSMDSQLFQLLLLGLALLSISLYLGVNSNIGLHGRALVFSHHIVLTMLAWLGFSALILGRLIWGWRGRKAAYSTLITYGLFVLGYFGTRVVRELILS